MKEGIVREAVGGVEEENEKNEELKEKGGGG